MKVDQFFGKARSSVRRLKPAVPWIGGIGGLSLLVFTVVWIPKWQVPSGVTDDKERVELENANRQTALQALGGLFFLVTAGLTLKNLQLTEDKSVTDRFSKAVEMLADEKLEMRLGGIYSLERIARDSKEDHPVVMEVLTAFVRDRTGKPEDVQHGSSANQQQSQGAGEKLDRKPGQDIQSALTVIGRRNIKNDQQPINLTETNLQGADLRGAHLEEANLANAHLEGAKLWFAHLEGAKLWFAYLERADLRGAHLEGADLSGVDLKWADLRGAYLERADLTGAYLERAFLRGAYLERADLTGARLERADLRGAYLDGADLSGVDLKWADLRGAHLDGADLRGAHLDGAENITEVQLSQAKLCRTRLPQDINNLDPNRDCEELGLSSPQTDEIESNEDDENND